VPRKLPRRSFRRWSGRGRGFSPQPVRPAPISEGEEYDVTGEAEGRRGDGIAKIKGFTVFVSGLKIGEKARVKIVSVRPRFAIAVKSVGEVEG
jgi:predicted RNA-binding protein with TRAM domain